MEIFKLSFIPFTIIDAIDITLMAFILYKIQKAISRSLALQGVAIVFLVYLAWQLVDILELTVMKAVLEKVLQVAAFALVVVFAPEIKRMLLELGQNPIVQSIRHRLSENLTNRLDIEEVIYAVEQLANTRTGALIVLVGENDLPQIYKTGDMLNAMVSSRLLVSIFSKRSPLHDGAVVIRENIIVAARCVLPVSDDPDLPPELGLRHRSALGVTEVTDSAAIIVSEETGKVSVALNGRIKRNLASEELRRFLQTFYSNEKTLF
jgi:uncharacterized protein (TIGR00159 family)